MPSRPSMSYRFDARSCSTIKPILVAFAVMTNLRHCMWPSMMPHALSRSRRCAGKPCRVLKAIPRGACEASRSSRLHAAMVSAAHSSNYALSMLAGMEGELLGVRPVNRPAGSTKHSVSPLPRHRSSCLHAAIFFSTKCTTYYRASRFPTSNKPRDRSRYALSAPRDEADGARPSRDKRAQLTPQARLDFTRLLCQVNLLGRLGHFDQIRADEIAAATH